MLDLDKMKKLLLFLLSFSFAGSALAGGSSFQMKITSFKATGGDKYIMEITQLSDSYMFEKSSNKFRTIHLRFSPKKLRNKSPHITKENYLKAIEQLKADFKKGEPSYFGTMGTGLKKTWLRKNHWQSNALSILEEYDGKMVVYSFANPT